MLEVAFCRPRRAMTHTIEVTEVSGVMHFGEGVEFFTIQHGMTGEQIWTPLPLVFICLQQGIFALSHVPKIEDWHPAAGCIPARPSDNTIIASARIQLKLYQLSNQRM